MSFQIAFYFSIFHKNETKIIIAFNSFIHSQSSSKQKRIIRVKRRVEGGKCENSSLLYSKNEKSSFNAALQENESVGEETNTTLKLGNAIV
jgi:hypothetical protein